MHTSKPVKDLALTEQLQFADVFALGYGQSVGIVGTNFLAMGLGMIVGTFATVKVMDRVFTRGGEKKFKPESR